MTNASPKLSLLGLPMKSHYNTTTIDFGDSLAAAAAGESFFGTSKVALDAPLLLCKTVIDNS